MFNSILNPTSLGVFVVSLILLGIVKLVSSEFGRFQRKEEIAEFARELGFEFENDKLRSQELVHQRYAGFKLVLHRAAATFRNMAVLQSDESKLSIFDYGYRAGTQSSEPDRLPNTFQSVVAVEFNHFELQQTFCLSPEDHADSGTREHLPQALKNLIQAHPNYSFEGVDNIVWVYEHGKLQSAEEYPQLIELGHQVREAIEHSVLQAQA